MCTAFRHFMRSILRLLLVSGFVCSLTAPALAQETMAQAMAYAIARMMEAMGFPNTGVTAAQQFPVNPMMMNGLPSAFSALPSMVNPATQAMTLAGNSPLNQILERFNQSWSASSGHGSATAEAVTSLEGLWEDNQGGLLIVQRDHYRIYSSCNGFTDGDILISADRIALTNRRENFTQTFEFARDQGRLVLRNHNGDVFLYRLLILGEKK